MTLRTRVASAAGAAVFAALAVVSGVLFAIYAASLRNRVDADLVAAAQQASGVATKLKQSASGAATPFDITDPVTVGGTELQLLPGPVSTGERTRFGALTTRDVAVADQAQPAYFATVDPGGHRWRVYTAAIPGGGPGGGLVRVGRAASADNGAQQRAALLLAGLTVAGAAVVFIVARLAAGRLLRPIGELTADAEHVARTRDPAARLTALSGDRPRRPDEVDRLRAAFDAMLAELDRSAVQQRQLVGDASHELRTPLTSLIANLDLLEDGAGLADPQAPAVARAAREAAGELDTLVADLLELARSREIAPHTEDIRLDLLAGDAVRRAAARTPQLRYDTSLVPVLVRADPAAVDRAVGNLLDNAAKWSPPGGTICVEVSGNHVAISDHGPGIDAQDLPHIFERFYRSPAARARPGAGLGLAIVARIAETNGGSIDVRTGTDEGSTFVLALPAAPCEGV